MEFYSPITPTRLRYAMDSGSHMSKLKAMTGLRISLSPSTSTYILEKKIRKIIEHYSVMAPYNEQDQINRAISRLDSLEGIDIEYLYFLGTEVSVSEMIKTMKLRHKQINKLAQRWREGCEQIKEQQRLVDMMTSL